MTDSILEAKVLEYCRRSPNTIQVRRKLGAGTDGSVWITSVHTAIKAYYDQIQFDSELRCFLRLEKLGIDTLHGYSVPRLVNASYQLLVIEMTTVSPPYLLDFGKAYLDEKPSFTPQQWSDLYNRVKQIYGERYDEVMRVVNSLQQFGIYYYDITLNNVMPDEWNPSLDDEREEMIPDDFSDEESE